MSPLGLIPEATVKEAPGTSMVVKPCARPLLIMQPATSRPRPKVAKRDVTSIVEPPWRSCLVIRAETILAPREARIVRLSQFSVAPRCQFCAMSDRGLLAQGWHTYPRLGLACRRRLAGHLAAT